MHKGVRKTEANSTEANTAEANTAAYPYPL
jgi:hypothetical protein